MLTNEKLEEIGELAGKATYKPFDSEHERNLSDVCDSEIIEEMAKEILSLRAVLDGLPPEAIAGGWTAKGISAYVKKLELQQAELGKLEFVGIEWRDEKTGHWKRLKKSEVRLGCKIRKLFAHPVPPKTMVE
ncbi:hypothetical protein HER17_05295 [Pectobacterium carotovorum]|uniref:hypothetical protein n=1 Tax=Pectobacterium TaxID=122277 RepID=UPI0001A4486D|nr:MULTISPECIES: hypothetical protein [Pectobacterium]MBQ4781283.1 hypothetical protein [Pectobacterium versatile]MBQ4785839.1 hypothetical protein [Pectobacterium versatile]MBQ4791708.1 hypothetical protein [Pectobacterium versatile]MCL6366040.1 hypothetical protein [Pectobacterium carotovorum subsp. carotovorum]QLL92397.1 hypothetical protein HER17_05295 [Pectobacterium carotovorum]